MSTSVEKPSTQHSGDSSYLSFRSHSSVSSREEEVDWKGLEEKFIELKGFLSAPTFSFSNSSEERRKQRENVELGLEAIIEVALSESTLLYQDGNYKEAYMAALKTLWFVQQLYGTSNVEQIDVYFLLAKISQSMKKFKQAEEFLSIAQWTIIKNPKISNQIRAELHQNFGLLFVKKGVIKKAIHHLATSVYYMSLIHGTNHIVTSFGYFNLGNVFASQGTEDAAIDFLEKVTKIWHDQLLIALRNAKRESGGEKEKEKELCEFGKIDEEKLKEGSRMFEQILNITMERFTDNSIETAKVFVVLGLYQWYMKEPHKAKECLEKSLSITKYVLGDNHSDIEKIETLLKDVMSF